MVCKIRNHFMDRGKIILIEIIVYPFAIVKHEIVYFVVYVVLKTILQIFHNFDSWFSLYICKFLLYTVLESGSNMLLLC